MAGLQKGAPPRPAQARARGKTGARSSKATALSETCAVCHLANPSTAPATAANIGAGRCRTPSQDDRRPTRHEVPLGKKADDNPSPNPPLSPTAPTTPSAHEPLHTTHRPAPSSLPSSPSTTLIPLPFSVDRVSKGGPAGGWRGYLAAADGGPRKVMDAPTNFFRQRRILEWSTMARITQDRRNRKKKKDNDPGSAAPLPFKGSIRNEVEGDVGHPTQEIPGPGCSESRRSAGGPRRGRGEGPGSARESCAATPCLHRSRFVAGVPVLRRTNLTGYKSGPEKIRRVPHRIAEDGGRQDSSPRTQGTMALISRGKFGREFGLHGGSACTHDG